MMIVIRTIPHAEQRYPTAGDYWWDDDGTWQIRVSDLGDWRKELLLGLHELIESGICRHKGISEQSITDFDIAWEKKQPRTGEPGDSPEAPYFNEHQFATSIERICSFHLGVDWVEYNAVMDAL